MSNARNWTAILYPEHLIDNWQNKISELLEYPYVYCIHDKDTLLDLKSEIETFPDHTEDDLNIKPDNDNKSVIAENYKRKVHIHIIISFPNTTTYNHALEVLQRLYRPNHKLSIVKQVLNIRYLYNYLIHDTDKCREDHKYLYDVSERIEGNDFDIGALEQLSQIEKKAILKELKMLILEKGFCNFADFTMYVITNYDDVYSDVLDNYASLLEKLTRGNYQRLQWIYQEKDSGSRKKRKKCK